MHSLRSPLASKDDRRKSVIVWEPGNGVPSAMTCGDLTPVACAPLWTGNLRPLVCSGLASEMKH